MKSFMSAALFRPHSMTLTRVKVMKMMLVVVTVLYLLVVGVNTSVVLHHTHVGNKTAGKHLPSHNTQYYIILCYSLINFIF